MPCQNQGQAVEASKFIFAIVLTENNKYIKTIQINQINESDFSLENFIEEDRYTIASTSILEFKAYFQLEQWQ